MIYSFDAGGTLTKVLNSDLSFKEYFNNFDDLAINESTKKVIATGARANRLKKNYQIDMMSKSSMKFNQSVLGALI